MIDLDSSINKNNSSKLSHLILPSYTKHSHLNFVSKDVEFLGSSAFLLSFLQLGLDLCPNIPPSFLLSYEHI